MSQTVVIGRRNWLFHQLDVLN